MLWLSRVRPILPQLKPNAPMRRLFCKVRLIPASQASRLNATSSLLQYKPSLPLAPMIRPLWIQRPQLYKLIMMSVRKLTSIWDSGLYSTIQVPGNWQEAIQWATTLRMMLSVPTTTWLAANVIPRFSSMVQARSLLHGLPITTNLSSWSDMLTTMVTSLKEASTEANTTQLLWTITNNLIGVQETGMDSSATTTLELVLNKQSVASLQMVTTVDSQEVGTLEPNKVGILTVACGICNSCQTCIKTDTPTE